MATRRVARLRRATLRWGRRSGRRTWRTPSEPMVLVLLLVLVAVATASSTRWPSLSPPAAFVVPLLVGGYFLRTARYRLLAAAVALGALVELLPLDRRAGAGDLVVLAFVGLVADRLSRQREISGVPGLRGDTMLVDLRDRLQAQGEVPPLPAGWTCDVDVRSAAASSTFSGDFVVVASRQGAHRSLELALVDVSGKGIDAATRALLLSGAMGGLIGAVPAGDFLNAAGGYLLRQGWEEGFATAVHLAIDLETGDYTIDSAGHPPAAHFDAGSGRWRLVEAEGSVLGLDDTPATSVHRGRMRPGDAVLMYTDGVVETPGRDLAVGIDRLLGEADRLVTRGFGGSAGWLLERASPSTSDDRAVVVVHRRS